LGKDLKLLLQTTLCPEWAELAFPIGAASFKVHEQKVLPVEEISIEFADLNSAVMVSVLYCNTIHEYVFALLDIESIKGLKKKF